MNILDVTPEDRAWKPLGSGVTALMIQPFGNAVVHFGGAAPAPGDAGITLESGVPYVLPYVDAFGGGAWVRFTGRDGGRVVYAAA